MTETTSAPPAPADGMAPQAIRPRLVDRVAPHPERNPADIDEGTQLAEMGLDSVYALTLCGDVEDRFGLVVEPTLAWDHPTIDAITAHLAAAVGGAQEGVPQ